MSDKWYKNMVIRLYRAYKNEDEKAAEKVLLEIIDKLSKEDV